MYKYEMHCHTKYGSLCGRMSASDIVELYLANDYDGVCITDHFLNGNSIVHRDCPNGTYEEKIGWFCQGYEEVKACAAGRLKVFFGFEASYLGTDILVYGVDEQRLKQLSQLPEMDLRSLCDFCREIGALAVQAHPFREASYIDHIRLYPNCEGVETFNSARDQRCNDLAAYYAKAYGKVSIGGSDIHHVSQKTLSGMAFDEEVHSMEQLIALIRSGKGEILNVPNQYQVSECCRA